MSWLVSHMWVSLVAAAALALVLGWAFRGALLKGRVRRAEVERDILRVELQEAREEIEKLFEAQRKQAALAQARGADVVPPDATGPLQARLAELEEELSRAREAASSLQAMTPPAPASPDARLAWQAGYLRQRVRALENELAASPATPPEAPAADLLQEEVARLRWRNRYLEGRLAYFEGDAASLAQEAGEAGPDAVPGADGQGGASVTGADTEAASGEPAPGDPGPGETGDEAPGAEDPEEGAGFSLSSAPEPIRPLALDRAVDGVPDDLTLVGGIGPKIAEVLNGLGIFHFDQIADWTPENVAWVDQYLNFNGRISREGWVEQAAILVGEAGEN